jgi:hypothetical protein
LPVRIFSNEIIFFHFDVLFFKQKKISLVLPPKYIDCTPYYPDLTNQSSTELNISTSRILNQNLKRIFINGQIRKLEPVYNYSKEYGRSVLIDVKIFFFEYNLKNNFLFSSLMVYVIKHV